MNKKIFEKTFNLQNDINDCHEKAEKALIQTEKITNIIKKTNFDNPVSKSFDIDDKNDLLKQDFLNSRQTLQETLNLLRDLNQSLHGELDFGNIKASQIEALTNLSLAIFNGTERLINQYKVLNDILKANETNNQPNTVNNIQYNNYTTTKDLLLEANNITNIEGEE